MCELYSKTKVVPGPQLMLMTDLEKHDHSWPAILNLVGEEGEEKATDSCR
jgi:hypothetical protein